jgi:Helix-turn-helix domain of transposase family ISL3
LAQAGPQEGRKVAPNKRRRGEDKLILTLACGATVEAAARQCGVSESTVYRRLDDAGFRRTLSEVRTDMVRRGAGMLTAAAMESIKTLLELQKPAVNPAVRLGSARAVLEIGIRLREAADLEGRIAALEEQLALSQAG